MAEGTKPGNSTVLEGNADIEGLAGFTFDIDIEDELMIASDITDHYVEDNTAYQDHIANKPVILTIKRMHGEKFLPGKLPETEEPILDTSKLSAVEEYEYDLTPGNKQLKAEAEVSRSKAPEFKDKLVNKPNLWQANKEFQTESSRQKQAFKYLMYVWENKKPLPTVNTPWGSFENMYIESFPVRQPELIEYWSEFTIKLKQIRQINTETVPFKYSDYVARVDSQAADEVNLGKTQGKEVTKKRKSLLLQGYQALTRSNK